MGPAADDRPRHVRAVTIRIHARHRQICVRVREGNPPSQIRMALVGTAVVEIERHVGARQIQIIGRRHRVRRHVDPRARQVVQQDPPVGQLDPLHAGQLRQRHQAVRMRSHREHPPQRHRLFGQQLGTQVAQGPQCVVPLTGKERQVQRLIQRQGLLLHRQRQQHPRHLVIRLVAQHCPRPRHRSQQARPLRRHPHQCRVVRDVGNELCPRFAQPGVKGLVQRSAPLDQITVRIPRGPQVLGHHQGRRTGCVNQRVLEQNGRIAPAQLTERLLRVAQAIGHLLGRTRSRRTGVWPNRSSPSIATGSERGSGRLAWRSLSDNPALGERCA